MRTYFIVIAFSVIFSACVTKSTTVQSFHQTYNSFLSGNPDDYIVSGPRQGGVMLSGGNTDNDELHRRFLSRANGGDVVVLRASGDDGYHEYFSSLAKIDSVETFVFLDRDASFDPYLIQKLQEADLIYFAGGDQSYYYNFWLNTPVQEAINNAIANGVPVGGTSAGMAILGEFIYTAETGSAVSDAALNDPYYNEITIGKNLVHIPALKGFITDTHFSERQRLGRLVSFLGRINHEYGIAAQGIAADEATALFLETVDHDPNIKPGMGMVYGKGKLFVLSTPANPPALCAPSEPLQYNGIRMDEYTDGDIVDLNNQKHNLNATVPKHQYELNASSGELKIIEQGLAH